ncbi:ATP-binding protein [Feifania hominis]|uniref:AAA family ATPase n=1 Tax=Feifania hominis TaxID=2763660 RepID=A0A926HUL6_9FIRM|nr:AAA family ATPase [Feifania hominis]MBC8536075.1 AAA family ATPase [Feifania hominis]
MRLTEIHIGHFGGLHDFTLRPEPGINLLCCGNEWGKSTVAAFLKFMFYGFPKRTRRRDEDPLESDRERYQPWSGERIEGSLTLESGGRLYRIDRTAGDRRDRVAVMDALTGEPVREVQDLAQPGVWLFGVDEGTFERTVFVRQSGVEVTAHGELETRIRNLVTTGDETTSYGETAEKLAKLKSGLMTPTGRGGSIVAVENEMIQQRLALERAQAAFEQHRSESRRLREVERRLAAVGEELATLERERGQAGLRERVARARRAAELDRQLRIERERAERKPAVTGEELDRLALELEELTQLAARRDLAEREQAAAETRYEQAEERARQTPAPQPAKRGTAAPAVILWLTALGAAAAAIVLSPLLWVAAGVLAVFGTLFFTVLRKPAEPDGSEETAARAQWELEEAAARLKDCEREASAAAQALRDALAQAAHTAQQCGLPAENEAQLRAAILQARQSLADSAAARERAALLENNLRALCGDEPPEELLRLAQQSVELPAAPEPDSGRERSLRAEQLSLTRERGELRARVEAFLEKGELPADCEERIAALSQKKRRQQDTYRALELASQALDEAFAQLRNNFTPQVNAEAGRLFSQMLQGRYERLLIDHECRIRVDTGSAVHELGYFSRGTRDAAYLAFRLAVSRLIYQGERPPMVFDDAFSNLDDARLGQCMELLRSLSQDTQILLLSCQTRERRLLGGGAHLLAQSANEKKVVI